ncbi:MAG: glycosyltransferase, partial [Bacteroidales bacterium]|nr:glycosyltransferase [Bacteroidales bacterium]
ENLGLAKSLNQLLDKVLNGDYEYIARMDADDISFATRLERQVQFLETNIETDCLGTWAIEINENGTEYFKKEMPLSHQECHKLFMMRDCMIHPAVMFRKSYFEKAGLYPEDTYFGEDTMMWAKGFVSDCKFANLPENLLYFRLDKNFFERRRGWKHAKSILILRMRVNKMLKYGWKAYLYTYLYALAKLMPTRILNLIYKKVR